ncbi:unnamed protein product [Caenorhabditis sp. 36 PRJEB53466]|nr:unnamed protein product [Caenorhabditis sp. 36 PRJEB53466]
MGDNEDEQRDPSQWMRAFGREMKEEMSKMMAMIGSQKKAEKVEEEKAPKVSSKGVQKNLDFNYKLKNVLARVTDDDDWKEARKEVLEMIKVRNAELVMLAADPGMLLQKEKLDSLKAMAGGADSADMTSLLLLSQMNANKAEAMVVPVKVEAEERREAESSQRSRSSAFGATRSVITPTSVIRKEIKKLIGQKVLIMSDIEPRCVSPLHVVEQGDEGVAMARHLMQKVGEAQKRRVSMTTRKRKSEDIQNRKPAESTSSITSEEPKEWDFLEGAKRQYVRDLETQAGPRMQHLIDALKLSGKMSKRSAWIETMQLPKNESSFLLYLVERGKKIGSSAMSKISAAYQVANEDEEKTRDSDEKKKPVEVTLEDIETITQRAMQSNRPASDRDALLAILSFRVMLRASEAAEIKWDGVTQAGDLIEVVVEKAKNDQMALGRRSFFNYEPGSDADILMCRWRLRCKERACEYVFSNLEGSKKADEAVDLGPGFEDAQGDREVGSDAPRIQESRSELLASAGTFDGRDQDVPEAQGCRRAVKGVGGDADESESDEE